LIGKVLGKYKITEGIGSGRLGSVYKGIQVGLEREVAVKVLPPQMSKDPILVQRFRKESQATARLSHPNIITIYDSGEQEGHFFYVMEFLAPESLRDKFDSGSLTDLKVSLKVAVDVLKALVYCHDKGVVHRDLDPSSIKFDLRGNAILTDFGVEKGPDERSSADISKAAAYLSPELYLKQSPDHRSDIYQFGVILYQLLTGKLPYPGKLPFVVGGTSRESQIAPPSNLNDKVIPELEAMCMKCLATDPSQRYQSTSQTLKELQKVERKQNIRQMSRQVDAPGYGRPTGAYTGTYSGVTGSMARPSGITQSISGVSAVDSMIQSQGFVSFIESLTGGYGDITLRETQIRLAVVIGPFAVLAVVAGLYLGGVIGKVPLKLLEQAKEVESKRCEISWKANAPCHSFIEFYTTPDSKRQTRPSQAMLTEFRQPLEDLRADTKYFFRFGFSYDENGSSPYYSSVYEFKTRPEIKIRDIQVVDRKHNQVTIRWSTNLETDTKVRIGRTRDYARIVENPIQRRELDHSIEIHGLKGNTTYHYQIVASDPDNPDQEMTSDDKRFVTRAEASGGGGNAPLKELAKSYVDKLTRMTPDEKEKLERSLSEFLPNVDNLTLEKKKELLIRTSTEANFHERRQYLSLWIDQFNAQKKTLPGGITEGKKTIHEEAEYLKSLYYVNSKRAVAKLDRCIRSMAQADGMK
jgi:serine/threonine protein kinase